MADTPQTLREFAQNLLSDLSSGAITVHEAYAAANQYAYLRQELTGASLTLSEAAALGDEELAQAFTNILSETVEKLAELPSFQAQQPDAIETEKNIRDVAALQKTATTRIRESGKNKPDKSKRRAFVHSLVDRFSSTLPALTENQIDRLVEKSSVAAARATPAEQQSRFTQQLADSIESLVGDVPGDQKQRIATSVRAAVDEQKDVVITQISATRQELAVYTALFGATELKRPDVFADIVLNAPQSEKLNESLTRAEKLARVAQSLEESGRSRGGKIQFFSANGAKGVAGGLQKGADGILSLIGEPAREMLLHEKVNGTLRSMLTSTQQFADRLGESFVHSAVFTHITQDLTKQLAQKPQGGQARSVFDDVFSSVFRGPLAAPLAYSTKSGILDFYELARANAAAPLGKKFLAPGVPPWDIFRAFTPAGTVSSASYKGPSARKPFLSLLGFGSFGNFLGDMVSGLIDKTTSMALLNPRLPGQLSASRRAAGIPTPLVDDMPLLTALVVVVVLVLLFLFPSPFNLNTINHSSKASALLAALSDGLQTIINPIAEIICVGECKWPTSGTITQGPNTNSSHKGTIKESIDIGTSCGTPVVSTLQAGAVVTGVFNECLDETGYIGNKCGGGWGNYVDIKGTINTGTGNATAVTVRLSHLMKNSMPPSGTVLQQGQKVGQVDHNGNSSNCHLHYEVRSGGPINNILPYPVPSCTNSAACCSQMGVKCNVTP